MNFSKHVDQSSDLEILVYSLCKSTDIACSLSPFDLSLISTFLFLHRLLMCLLNGLKIQESIF